MVKKKVSKKIKKEPKSATQEQMSDSQVIRRQLVIIVSLIALLLGGWGLWKWGEETGWGNPDRAVQIKMKRAQQSVVERRFAEAVEDYQSVLERYPEHPSAVQARTGLAGAYESLRNYSEAVKVYSDLLSDLRHDPARKDLAAFTQLQVAKLQRENGDAQAALASFEAVRRDYPGTDWSGEAQSGIGQVYQSRAEYKKAMEAYRVVIKELPRGFLAAEAQGHIGECLEAQGDTSGAIKAYKAVLSDYPSAVWDQAQERIDVLEKKLESEKADKKAR